MYLIRPVRESDHPAICKLSLATVSGGLTSLPQDPGLLKKKIEKSITSFSKEDHFSGEESYLFVLEETSTGKIGGISAIRASAYKHLPPFSYKIEKVVLYGMEQTILMPVIDDNGPSELCTLFLDPAFRHSGLGKLLSWSRLLMIASEKARFKPTLMAALRGVIDSSGTSPFFEAVGRPFFQLTFREIIKKIQQDPSVAKGMIPPYPLYVSLLPESARAVIAQPHPNTMPAYEMLASQGFSVADSVDPFDAGPKLEAKTEEVLSIKKSETAHFRTTTTLPEKTRRALVCNNRPKAFLATIIEIHIDEDGTLVITSHAADALQLEKGEKLRYLTIEGGKAG